MASRQIGSMIATLGGLGHSPVAPGTLGSLAALPMAWLIDVLSEKTGGLPLLVVAICLVILLGWWAADQHQKATGQHDSSCVIIDEVAGQWIALLFLPTHILSYAAAFLLFRLFDIWKPGPVGWADRQVKGGLGVMLDDILAGLMALAILYPLFQAFSLDRISFF